MTVAEVTKWVEDIRNAAPDDEVAHATEDALYHVVLQAIAKGIPNPSELATEALKAADIDFARWCA